jgi:hypothetical protein
MVSDWQPIETAPEHRGAFMILHADGTVGMAFREQSWKGRWRWSQAIRIDADGISMRTSAEPTHWMPLPEPPKE